MKFKFLSVLWLFVAGIIAKLAVDTEALADWLGVEEKQILSANEHPEGGVSVVVDRGIKGAPKLHISDDSEPEDFDLGNTELGMPTASQELNTEVSGEIVNPNAGIDDDDDSVVGLPTPEKPFTEMKKNELIAYAEQAEIEIDKSANKADILAAIEAAVEAAVNAE